MPGRWTKWYPLTEEYFQDENSYGIYAIQLVNCKGDAVPIPRLCGEDPNGTLYIGKAQGISLAMRLRDFFTGFTRGGGMYYRMYNKLRRRLGKVDLKYRVMVLQDTEIEVQEKRQILNYTRNYCEPPPFNSNIPGRGEL